MVKVAVALMSMISILIIGFTSATVSMFLQWLYKWNYIGQLWIILLRFIRFKIKNKKYKSMWENLCYPLGYCVYCQSSWIAIFISLYLSFDYFYVLMALGINFYFIEKFNMYK